MCECFMPKEMCGKLAEAAREVSFKTPIKVHVRYLSRLDVKVIAVGISESLKNKELKKQ